MAIHQRRFREDNNVFSWLKRKLGFPMIILWCWKIQVQLQGFPGFSEFKATAATTANNISTTHGSYNRSIHKTSVPSHVAPQGLP
ncbi:hypothetical protein Fmac_027570 [Flemingia macrophylla]|uniref:Uncharacterized protein n=1 Tax=Flemingia macrophylla TaxID=520843 RepID=A0ABD1LI86_9FABA